MYKLVKWQNRHETVIKGLTSESQARSRAVIENDNSALCEFMILDEYGPVLFGTANHGTIEWTQA